MAGSPNIPSALRRFVQFAVDNAPPNPKLIPPRHHCDEDEPTFIEYVSGGWELDLGNGDSPIGIAFCPFCGLKLEAP